MRNRPAFAAAAAATVSVLLALGAPVLSPAQAAASYGPVERTVALPATPGRNVVTYDGHAPFNNGSTGIVADDPQGACSPDGNAELNDQHVVQVTVPPRIDDRYDTLIRFQIDWDSPVNETIADLALHVFGPDGQLVATSDGSQPSEGINITDQAPGVYDVLVCAFQTGPTGQDYRGEVIAQTTLPPAFPAAKGVTPPTYRQYEAPAGVAAESGEPSIGNSWKSGKTLYTSYTNEYVVDFDDTKGTSTWTLVNDDVADPANKVSLDPIGFTDSVTGRTFVSQLYLACSAASYSDDDFDSPAVPSQGCGSLVNGFDHQTFGGGPFPQGVSALTAYPHAVYYCSQAPGLVTPGATCARSDDGGLTFGPTVQVYGSNCSGIHGHVRVGPEGNVYLPNDKCGGNQGVAVSTDGGATWNVTKIADSVEGASDPSVAAGSDGTVYFGYSDGTGKPRIAVSTDKGKTFGRSVDVGLPFGIHNSEFAEVIAGDGDRAAFAFVGTPTRGSTQAASFGKSADGKRFTGAEWHMYVATTYDRGRTWTTVDATPKDPVQRGCVWNSGGGNPCRNLLDFNDITVDRTGHVMVGFADGCVPGVLSEGADCVASTLVEKNTLAQHGAIVRQTAGKGLFKAFDAQAAVGGSRPSSGNGTTAPVASGGRLPATGAAPLVALSGALLLAGALVLRRRRTV